ncbi:hypothetical protein Tdes44962_MAKER06090 [Teratosphaeria destructans]|uniref:Uncharacterized protein n=1 Tax=Teratosphaeria destructans TaxID=418781 RepID=A0A9W7SI53_9PEZI|nr:hypothetical protein Tdes44962_MAKER06090 [Teratosphaeria destructans]
MSPNTNIKLLVGSILGLLTALLVYLATAQYGRAPAPAPPLMSATPDATPSLHTVTVPCFVRRTGGVGATAYQGSLCREVFLD